MQNSYQIHNSGETEINLIEEIGENWYGGGMGKMQFADLIKGAGNNPIKLKISSPGGDCDTAFAMYDMLKAHKGAVTATLSGVVASAATIVACGADKVEMSDNSLYMIHNPWSVAIGDADEMRKTADLNDKVKNIIVGVYQKQCNSNGKNLKASQLSKLMDEETWMDLDEAMSYGFVHAKVSDAPKTKNCIDLAALHARGFLNIPQDKIKLINNNQDTNMNEFQNILAELKAGFADLKAAFIPAKTGATENVITEEVFTNKTTELTNSITTKFEAKFAEAETKITTLENSIVEKDATLLANKTIIEKGADDLLAANTEVARLSAGNVAQPKPGDPTSGAALTDPLEIGKNEFLNNLTEGQKAQLKATAKK